MKKNNWNKYIKTFIIIICVLLMLPICIFLGILGIFVLRDLLFPIGDGKYDGDYPELYSIAINSVLGTRGYEPDLSHGPWPSRVGVVEKDSLGRVMFIYHEGIFVSESGRKEYNLIISQKNDAEYAYYYPDYNFISISLPSRVFSTALDTTGPTTSRILNVALKEFSDEEIEKLKRRNDWNMNIDIDKCEKTEIVRQKAKKGPVEDSKIEDFLRNFYRNKGLDQNFQILNFQRFFAKDNYNRSMYIGYYHNENKESYALRDYYNYFVMFFQPDGSYDEKNGILEVTDVHNYQDDLKAFKERNNWNVRPE